MDSCDCALSLVLVCQVSLIYFMKMLPPAGFSYASLRTDPLCRSTSTIVCHSAYSHIVTNNLREISSDVGAP